MTKENKKASGWTYKDSAREYGIERWSSNYFGVSEDGEVVVKAPTTNGIQQVSLKKMAKDLEERGLEMPVLLRLDNLVDARINELNLGFASAIKAGGYQNHYRGVFPIKVNQQSHVIQEIASYGEKYSHGLEAGSKAELLVAMATLKNSDSLIVCNGYKDEEFIDLGLQARKLGLKCFFVVETPKEIPIILERSKHWGVDPLIGMRLKLSTKVDGQWSGDSGDRSLFGLTTTQIISVIDALKAVDKLGCLQLLHFHLGSQIPNIRNIRDGVREACRYYISLINEGAQLSYIDLGGGLAVDYDGTGNGDFSMNYTLDEYCTDIVEGITESLDPFNIPHPMIVTESGRALVAPMSVLLFNVLDVNTFEPTEVIAPAEDACEPLLLLWGVLQSLELKRLQEYYNDALYYRDQLKVAYSRGLINLRERAQGENYYLAIMQCVSKLVPQAKYPSEELLKLDEMLADIYYCNFSVFQSLPDSWAIGQIFPVMPIHRLNEEPTRNAVIADLTCDCDGKLDKFVGEYGDSKTLKLHPLIDDEEYYLGTFLVGAYQETLGDLHNLFGDTNIASVRITEDGTIEYVYELEGDSIADVLSYVEYQPKDLYKDFLSKAEQSVRDGKISVKERRQMLKLFNESLSGYTYFER